MKVLVFGGNGWIGQQFIDNTTHDVVIAATRPENKVECYEEIKSVAPDTVISFIGRTYGNDEHGTRIPSIDYLELPGKLQENIRDNLFAIVNLADICESLQIQFVYLGTGCIYTYTDQKKVFTEEDAPNFFGSSYSTVKGYTDQLLRTYSHTLQLRIRMPVSRLVSHRNLIDKLVGYPNICSIPNSMTVLDDMWPIIHKMIEEKEVGVYNMTNPGTVEHNWILEQYRHYIQPDHTWNIVSYEEQLQYIASGRSNNELSTAKIEAFCQRHGLELMDIQSSILRCIQNRR